jgi:hypothetical protein
MRAYKFLNECFGMKALIEKRLKQSRIRDLNDPFELRPFDLASPSLRDIFLQTRDDMDEDRGLICFSAQWDHPVTWAHYGDSQRGLCLGFDVPNSGSNLESEVMRVHYEPMPLPFPSDFDPDKPQLEFARAVLSTKSEDWHYEKKRYACGSPWEILRVVSTL